MAAAEAANCIMEVSEAGVAGKGLRGGGRSEPGPFPRLGPGHAERAPHPRAWDPPCPGGPRASNPFHVARAWIGARALPAGPGRAGPGLGLHPLVHVRDKGPAPAWEGRPGGPGGGADPPPGLHAPGPGAPEVQIVGPHRIRGSPELPGARPRSVAPAWGTGWAPRPPHGSWGGTRSVAHGPRAPFAGGLDPPVRFWGVPAPPQDHLPSRGGRPQLGK